MEQIIRELSDGTLIEYFGPVNEWGDVPANYWDDSTYWRRVE